MYSTEQHDIVHSLLYGILSHSCREIEARNFETSKFHFIGVRTWCANQISVEVVWCFIQTSLSEL